MKRQAFGVAVVCLFAVGCTDPPDITPVAPPGMEYRRMPVIPEAEAAQALGEQPAAAAGQMEVAELTKEVSPPTAVGVTATTKSGLQYVTLREGTGREARPGDFVRLHYTGTFTDGRKFESSRDRNQPIQLRLGTGQVIKGWDEGISGMKVGEQRRLTIPPHLAYGPAGQPPAIPSNATLVFEVELLDVSDSPQGSSGG